MGAGAPPDAGCGEKPLYISGLAPHPGALASDELPPPRRSRGERWARPAPLRGRAHARAQLRRRRHGGQRPLVELAALLQPGRQAQVVAHVLGVGLVDDEAGPAELGDLEEHAAGLGEVDRAEEVAVDDLGGAEALVLDDLVPGLDVLGLAAPGHVLDDTGAEAALPG